MRRIQQKLNSQSGASILLALLFLLVCMMVAASILMAAASNAGKIRSNYEEQQKYLLLSSALRLAAGEIGKAEYTGKYTVTTWEEPVEWDEAGNPTDYAEYYRLDQAEGEFSCGGLGRQPEGSPADGETEVCVLPLLEELDGIWGSREAAGVLEDTFFYTAAATHTLTLAAEAAGFDDLDRELGKITITVQMNQNRRIHLKAELKETENEIYHMEAELTPDGSPVVNYVPSASQLPGVSPSNPDISVTVSEAMPAVPSIKWNLAWIAKEEATG